ncbi:hypothetical protein QYM36_019048 [Artemia franciscana]|uniref:Uncharacterized protein n=1 Tax=Artemia franciscana TaxID=6661 RepID=A0AA88H1M7_ARTSF|nr:hypothetical protein QYM36_019048 [Artemia franciscana]
MSMAMPSLPGLSLQPSLYPRDMGMSALDRNILHGLSGTFPGVPSDPRLSALGLDPLQQAYLADRERDAFMKLNANRYGLGLGYGMERFQSPGLDIRELERAKLAAALGLGSSSIFNTQTPGSYSGLGLPPVSAPSLPSSSYPGFSHYPKPPSATSFGYGVSPSGIPSMLTPVSRSSGLSLGLGSGMGLSQSSVNGLYAPGNNTFLPPSLRGPMLPQTLGLNTYPGLPGMGVRPSGYGFPGLDGSLGPRPPF